MAGTVRGWMGRGAAGVLRDRQTALAAMLAFWTLVGLVTALQDVAAARVAGDGPVSAAVRLGQGLEASLLWVPLTLLVVALYGRFPLEGPGWRRSVAVHAFGCVAVPLLYNVLFWLGRAPELSLDVLGRFAVRDWLAHLHLAGAVYWAIVLVDRGRRAPDGSRPSGGRSAPRDGAPGPAFVAVRSGPRVHTVAAGRIAWIEGAGDYARLHVEEGTFLASRTLGELARHLAPQGFLRIHRSTIVNLRRVRRFRPLGHGDYTVTLDDGTELRVSRGRGREFRRRMTGQRRADPASTPETG